MRVLHVGSGNLYGGVESQFLTMARSRQICADMEQQFAFSFEGRVSSQLRLEGVPVHHLGEARVSRPWTIWRGRQRLKALIAEQRYDAVICHSAWPLAVFGPAVKRSSTLVFWLHDWTDGRHWLDRWARNTVPDSAICNSRFTASSLPNLFPEMPAQVINCPVKLDGASKSTARRSAVRKQAQVRDDEVVIIQVSRMEAWKGHALHLQALALIKDLPSWTCWLVGGAQRPEEKQYVSKLQETAAALGIADRVQFLGQRSDVPDLLAAADIFCQPNKNPEPFGIVFIEALLSSLPIVSTAMGGAQEIIDNSCGVLIPPGDAKALSCSLRELITSQSLRESLGSRGPARAKELCDPRTQLESLKQTISTVIGSSKKVA
jgi:glycosyltransferase involved in cell wall biosynthesis